MCVHGDTGGAARQKRARRAPQERTLQVPSEPLRKETHAQLGLQDLEGRDKKDMSIAAIGKRGGAAMGRERGKGGRAHLKAPLCAWVHVRSLAYVGSSSGISNVP